MSQRQSLRQVIAQTSKAVRTGPIELRRVAEVAATLNASRPSPNSGSATMREVEQERDEWREEAWRCYVESGADPDGADARHLNPGEAIRAVRELRADYDAACDEAEQARAKLAQLKQSVEVMAEWPCDNEPGPRCPDLGKPEELDHGWCPSCHARAVLASLTTEE